MATEYENTWAKYRELAARARNGDKKALADKALVRGELRDIEREAARKGEVLNPVVRNGNVVAEVTETDSKRSRQEEYIRKFDPEKTVMIDGKEQTLRQYHSKRLLGRSRL